MQLRQIIWDLSYNSQGAFNHDVVYDLPIPWRTYYYNKLVETKQQEQEEIKKQERSAKTRKK